MRYLTTKAVLTAVAVWLVLFCGVSVVMGAEENNNTGNEDSSVYYETEGNYFLGYRFVTDDDSLKAAEHMYPHSSPTFGLNLLSCPLPYRYHVNAEFLSSYDFYADTGFAYKDGILFRDILVGAHHNLEHLNYLYSGETGLAYNDLDPTDIYDVDYTSNLLALRLKVPDYPLHAFINQRHIERDGRIQQRFLIGSFNQINKTSESRHINWKSDAYKLGANSHAGPVEIEYTYEHSKFNPGSNNALYDYYPDYTAALYSRPADTYPHNVVPETESSANSLKFHSSYTGGIVTAATISNLHLKNNYSGAESSTWKGAFDFSWIPEPIFGIFFKYRHRTMDMDTPDVMTLAGLNNSLPYSVREGISLDKDVFSLSARYKPLRVLSLYATYEFSHLKREDYAEWVALPGESSIHSLNLTAHLRPLGKMKIKAMYDYKNYIDPSYNNTPDSSNQVRLTTSYILSPRTVAFLEYLRAETERDSLHYLNSDPAVLMESGEREGKHDQFLASLTTTFTPEINLTASWYYQRWEVKQDLQYGRWLTTDVVGLPFIDSAVPYTDRSNSFSLSLQYMPWQDLTFIAGLTYITAKGESSYGDPVGDASFALSSFSELKINETIFSFDVVKRLSKEWEIGVRTWLDIYDDKAYDFADGKVLTTTVSLKRYF
ncbi:MAG: hypothetical protein V1706_10805 [Pseudomonadota bacterium]